MRCWLTGGIRGGFRRGFYVLGFVFAFLGFRSGKSYGIYTSGVFGTDS